MAKKTRMRIDFPIGGLNRQPSYRQQKPYTTTDCLNVRPVGALENRRRGGSRPGLVQSHTGGPGEGTFGKQHFLGSMTLASRTNFVTWTDTFDGSAGPLASVLSVAWVQASWVSAVPTITADHMVSAVSADGETAVMKVWESIWSPVIGETYYDYIDTSQIYTVEMRVVPQGGAFHGTYRLFLRLDSRTSDVIADGVIIEITLAGSGAAYSGRVISYTGSTPTEETFSGTLTIAGPSWLSVEVDEDAYVLYFDGANIQSSSFDSHTGGAIGFGLEGSDSTGCLIDAFRVQYFSKGISNPTATRTVLYALGRDAIQAERRHSHMEEITLTGAGSHTAYILNEYVFHIDAAQSGQKLYIANHGDPRVSGTDGVITGAVLTSVSAGSWSGVNDVESLQHMAVLSDVGGATVAGTYEISSVGSTDLTLKTSPGDGTCTFSIEAVGPLVVDMTTGIGTSGDGARSLLLPTAGLVPSGCPLIVRYLDRLILAGARDAPHVWYASRQGDETDWDYAQTDSQRAVAGTASAAGIPGTAITALISHSDDYLIIGCYDSIWRMRGDPAYGRGLDALSYTVGIIGPGAWCLGPEGELIFLSSLGLYALSPGGDSEPVPISRDKLPQEFRNVNIKTNVITLAYDARSNGVFIFFASVDQSEGRVSWWLDWSEKTFWPLSLQTGHEPFAAHSLVSTAAEESAVILLCRDGKLRRFDDLADSDHGISFSSYVDVGPISLAKDGSSGILLSMDASMSESSGDTTWGVYPGLTFEAAASAGTASETGTWVAGLNARVRPVGRGQAFKLRITGSSANRKWSMEQIVISVKESGQRRIA